MNHWQIATFKTDITPLPGEPLAYGYALAVESPIYIRGMLLDDGTTRIVLLNAEIIGYDGTALRILRQAVAGPAGTTEENIFIHTMHLHGSLALYPEAREVNRQMGNLRNMTDEVLERIAGRLAKDVAEAVGAMRKVGGLSVAERRVRNLASTRRLPDGRGGMLSRWSFGNAPDIREREIGLIDPILRSIFLRSPKGDLLTALHFYASHPMAEYGRDVVNSDAPGVALAELETRIPGCAEFFFVGAGGDVTFGKYSSDAPGYEASRVIGRRLADALYGNFNLQETQSLGQLRIIRREFEFPLHQALNPERLRERLQRPFASKYDPEKWQCAKLPFLEHYDRYYRKFPVVRIELAPAVNLVFMPGEPMVEYQLYLQKIAPEEFIACAAYGCSACGYIPTASMFAEGGYETTLGVTVTDERCEERLKAALTALWDK